MPSTQTDRLQGLSTSVAVKAPCLTVATSNITLSGLQTISGVTVAEDDRVLVMAQTDATENGIYNASTGAWQRAKDFDGNRDVVKGTLVILNDGAGSIYYRVTTSDPIVIGTSSINFEVVSGVLTQSIIGELLNPTDTAEDAAGVTIAQHFYNYGVVDRYGVNTTPGTTDMSAAVQAAANSGSGKVEYLPGVSYKQNSSVTIDASTTRVVGNGATIVSGLTTGYIFNIGASGGAQTVTRNPFSGLRLVGNSAVGVTAMNFEAVGLLAGYNVNDVSFEYFETDVRIYTNAFCINFNGCSFSQNTGNNIYVPGGGSNYGEKLTFNHCFFFNNTRIAYSTYNACQLFFNDCSLDYSSKVCEVDQGRAYFSNCYLESNLDTQYWFTTGTTESCHIRWTGGLISMTGAKTVKSVANAGSGSFIEFNDANFYASSNSVGGNFIGTGAGSVYARRCKINGLVQSYRGWAGASAADTQCSNGAFTTNLGGWTTSSTGGAALPARNATAGSGGGPAMEFHTDVAGQTSTAYWEIAATPGDNVGVQLNVKSENVNAAIYWRLLPMGNDSVIIGSPALSYGWNRFDAFNPAPDTNYHVRNLSTENGLPAGTTKVRLEIVSEYSSGYKVWIDGNTPVVLCRY